MLIVENCKPCSSNEVSVLKQYLSGTPVFKLIEFVKAGALVTKGNMLSVSEIGKLKTIWENLGEIHSKEEYNSDKYLVSQVISILSDVRCKNNSRTLEIINEYKSLLIKDKLELKITLLNKENDVIICDGNKRVVACYQYCLENQLNKFTLPVYIISDC